MPKAGPARTPHGYYRLRYDHVDAGGKVSIRRAGRMHHLGIGAAHRGKEILAITDMTDVTVIELRTGEVLSARPPATSTQPAPTGATNSEARAFCHLRRDSHISHVATHDTAELRGFEP
jgi:hypothetical protein